MFVCVHVECVRVSMCVHMRLHLIVSLFCAQVDVCIHVSA